MFHRSKKYIVLVAAVAMQACLGGIYAWSAFVPQLRQEFGYSATDTQIIFGTCVCVFSFLVCLTGRLQDRLGPRPLAVMSGLCVGAAYLLAGAVGGSFWPLWTAVGVVGGVGIALGYVCPIATAVKWFPNHAGLVSGLAVAGYGGGAVLLAAIVETLLARGYHVQSIFTMVGLAYCPVILLAGSCLFLPDRDAAAPRVAVPVLRLLADRRFWMLFTGMFCLTMPGLGVIGSLKPIGLSFGLSTVAAAGAISALAVGNASGRVLWGLAHDRIGSRPAMLGSLALMVLAVAAVAASSVVAIAGSGGEATAFVAAAIFLGFCFGGAFSVYPAQVSRLYGPAVVGTVYGMVIFAQGLAALAGPFVMGWCKDHFNHYYFGLTVAAAVALSGFAACAILSRRASLIRTS